MSFDWSNDFEKNVTVCLLFACANKRRFHFMIKLLLLIVPIKHKGVSRLYLNRCDSALKISEKLHCMSYFEWFGILLAEICWQENN